MSLTCDNQKVPSNAGENNVIALAGVMKAGMAAVSSARKVSGRSLKREFGGKRQPLISGLSIPGLLSYVVRALRAKMCP
jgi:hypothetical protein